MDFSYQHICVYTPLSTRLILLFCLFWPFVSIAFVARRETSSAPLTAMLVPLAVTITGTWLSFMNVLEGMAIAGGGRASTAAGFAEALGMLFTGALSVAGVAIVALLRCHRPVADRGTALLALFFAVDLIAALLFARFFTFGIARAVFVGIGASVLLVLECAVWLYLVARKRVTPQPLPMLAPALAVAIAALGLVVWRHVAGYVSIAKNG